MPSRRTWSPSGCCNDADIAVVGVDCRFPGAPDKDAFWRLLMDGVVADSEVPSQRWDVDAYYRADGAPGSMNTRRGHFIDDVDAFDNDFFGIAPIEAGALDPQQRLLLESSWRAIEDAGIDPRSLTGTPTGVFVGIMSSEWSNLQILDFAGLTAVRGTGSGYFITLSRISYHLGLTGPSVAIDSACSFSSSLTAVHQGCAALRSGEADTVIAAGANLILTPALSIFYTQAGLSAPDGRCKPFGLGADGIGRGEGARGHGGAAPARRRHRRWAADLCRREEFGHQPRRPQQRRHRPEPRVAGGADAPGAEPGGGRCRADRLRRSARYRHGARRHDRSQRSWRRAQDTSRRALSARFR